MLPIYEFAKLQIAGRRSRAATALMAGTTLLSGAVYSTNATAQSAPYDAGAAVREGEQAAKHAPNPRPAGSLNLPRLVEQQLTMTAGEKLLVRRFVLKGGEGLLEPQAAHALLRPYEGRRLTLAQIYEAADKVSALYREAGYLVAKVYVPEQDARSGTLKLKLVPGRYGGIAFVNRSLISDRYLQGLYAHQQVKDGALIRKDELERAMLLTSDLAGAGMPRSVMSAGRREGTSDFQFEVPDGRRLDGFILGDNYGSPYTGRRRAMAGVNLNSPLGFGDRLSAFGMVSETTDLINGRLSYAVPLGYDGLKAEIAAFRTTYALGGVYAASEATGVADGVSGTLSYPLKRSRDDTVVVSAGYTYKRLDDRVFDTSFNSRNLNEGTLAVNGQHLGVLAGRPLVASTNIGFTIGNVDYPDPDQLAWNAAGADTAGGFQKLAGGITVTWAVAEKLSLIIDARGQKSLTGNLDSSTQMGLTGVYGVRAYNEGLSGDSGWLLTPELKFELPAILGWQHAVSAFADFGGVSLENGAYTTTQPEYVSIADIGLGYYGTYEYMSGRMLVLKAHLAHSVSSDADTAGYDRGTVGLVQAGFTF